MIGGQLRYQYSLSGRLMCEMHQMVRNLYICIMLYQSVSTHSHKSVFRKSFSLQHRVQRRLDISQRNNQDCFCCLVLEYALPMHHSPHYELLCVSGKLTLKVLQQYIVRKMKAETARPALLLQICGKIKNPGQNIGSLSQKCSEEDGFLYVYVRSENSF